MIDSLTHIEQTIAKQLVGKSEHEATDILVTLFNIANHVTLTGDAYQSLRVDTEQAALLNTQMQALLSINLQLILKEINEEKAAATGERLDECIFYHQIYMGLRHLLSNLKHAE